MTYHDDFKDKDGILGIKHNGVLNKFCCECGHRMRCQEANLIDHYKAQHRYMKPEWLPHGESLILPKNSIYPWFREYLVDPYNEEHLFGRAGKIKHGRPKNLPTKVFLVEKPKEDEEEPPKAKR